MTMRNSCDGRIGAGLRVGGRRVVTVVALAVMAGCASARHPAAATPADAPPAPTGGLAPAAPPSSAAPALTDDLDTFSASAARPAPTVNVFGELDGVPRGNVRPIGDEGFQQQTFADEGYDADVAVDPAGRLMCFASTRHNEHAALYTQRTDGAVVTKLTNDDSDNAFPTFSPDGKQIAFCSTRSGTWNIYTMECDGRNVVTVTSGSAQCVHPSWSPDGTHLVYSSLGARSHQWELWVINLTTGERQQIGNGLFPTWCPARRGGPNGTVDKIAFQRARERGSRWFSLWTLDLVDGEARNVTEVAVSSNAAIVSPAWSPDGRRLAFATVLDPAHQKGGAGKQVHGEQDVWTIAADGTDRRRLTDGTGVNLSPCWSNDGRVYFVSNRGGAENVWSVRPEVGRAYTAAVPQQAPSPTAKPSETVPQDATANVRDDR